MAPQADLDFSIQAPRASSTQKGSDELQFEVKDLIVEGATVYSRADLLPLFQPLLGQKVGLSAITAVAEAIELKYHTDGYVLSRAFLPRQRVGDGIFRIQVLEGYVRNVSVEGASEGNREAIESYLKPVVAERPVKIGSLERALLLSRDLPGVSASGVLRPGDEPGAVDLVVTVTEKWYQTLTQANNRNSRYTGPWSVYNEATFNSLLDQSEQITLGYSTTTQFKEQRFGLVRYSMPVGNDGLSWQNEGVYSVSSPQFRLRELFVKIRSTRVSTKLSYPIIRGQAQNLALEGGAAYQETHAAALGEKLTHEAYPTVFGKINYLTTGILDGVTTASIGFTKGISQIASSKRYDRFLSRPDARPDFWRFNAEARQFQPIYGPVNMVLSAAGQYARYPLYAGEEFTAGSTRFGRGYDPAELSGRNGMGGTVELRYTDIFGVEPYAFYDTARVYTGKPKAVGLTLQSAGFGARYVGAGSDMISVGLEYAKSLTRAPTAYDGDRPAMLYLDVTLRF